MDNHKKTDYISSTILIGLLLLVVEITFFNKGLIVSLIFSSVLIYLGIKRVEGTVGKLLFLLGSLMLFFSIISMIVFKFIILAILGFVLYTFFKSKNEPVLIQPVLKEPEIVSGIRRIPRQSMFKNLFYGKQKTPEQIYEWDDINIQTGIGHVRIDLSNTVLPKGESIIVVRHFIGNVQILVPYDLEISVNHTVITGTTTVFNVTEEKLYNQNLAFCTDDYHFANQKVKIVTSIGAGRLEVKRI